jgi:hypothetical protein
MDSALVFDALQRNSDAVNAGFDFGSSTTSLLVGSKDLNILNITRSAFVSK